MNQPPVLLDIPANDPVTSPVTLPAAYDPWTMSIRRNGSSFTPAVPAFGAFVEGAHRLIRTSDLELEKVSPAPTTLDLGTLCIRRVDIVPAALAAQNIVDLLLLHQFAVVQSALNGVLVRARPAFKAELAICTPSINEMGPAMVAENEHQKAAPARAVDFPSLLIQRI